MVGFGRPRLFGAGTVAAVAVVETESPLATAESGAAALESFAAPIAGTATAAEAAGFRFRGGISPA